MNINFVNFAPFRQPYHITDKFVRHFAICVHAKQTHTSGYSHQNTFCGACANKMPLSPLPDVIIHLRLGTQSVVMGKKEVFVKQEQNDLDKLLHGANEEKAKLMLTRTSAVDDWKHVLQKHLEVPSTLPSVIKGDFQDAEKLFKPGKNGQIKAEVILRRKSTFFQRFPWQKRKPVADEIALPQFDPNLKSNAVVCRYPTCKNKNPDAPKRGTCVKRDLYLCRNHRERLKSCICEAMAEKGIEFHEDEFASEPGRFEGYTSLISLFDEASRKSRDEIVREAALNTRNFLIITSTLLNPDDENLSVALPAVADVTGRIVREAIDDRTRVENLLSLLRGIVDIILFAFGVLYTWNVPSNIGGKIGAGIGGIIGLGGLAFGPGGGVVGFSVGAVCGGLIGSGVYDLNRETRDQRRDDRARREWLGAGEGDNGGGGNGGGGNGAGGGDDDDGRQPQGMYQCTISDNVWDNLRMYIELCSAWGNVQVSL